MASRTPLTPPRPTASRPARSGRTPAGERSLRVQRAVRRGTLALVLACAVLFLFPVLAHPITGDDRYWYLTMGAVPDWSLLDELRRFTGVLQTRMEYGRVNVLTEVERRIAARSVIEPAVAAGTPVTATLAAQKLALLAGGVLAMLAMVRSLRWRNAAGHLVQVRRRTLILTGAAGTLALAVGAQAHSAGVNGWNGWVSYPVSTYGAVISIFGLVALLLWLARLVAERSRRTLITAVVVLAVLGVATNLRYELVFPSLPIAALALLVVPVTDRARLYAGRRAKVITGLAFFGAFAPVFLVTRLYLGRLCERQECYDGIQVDLGPEALRTAVYNLLSPVPGSGGTELARYLDLAAMGDAYPVRPTWWSVLAGLVVVAALMALWWSTRKVGLGDLNRNGRPGRNGRAGRNGRPGGNGEGRVLRRPRGGAFGRADRRAEATLLAVAAGIALLAALGTATIMGLSPHSHDLVSAPGVLYRNAVVTWAGLAFAAVLATLALGRILAPRGALLLWTTLVVLIGAVGALTLPGDLMALRASRVHYDVSEAINWEVVKGDLRPGSDRRRCDLFARAEDEVNGSGSRRRLYRRAEAAFQRYYGRPFCSDPGDDRPSG